jgi:hypothetical protein
MKGPAIYDDDGIYVCHLWEVAMMARNRKSKRVRQKVLKVLGRTREQAVYAAERAVKKSGSESLAIVGARVVGVGLAFHAERPGDSFDKARREALWADDPQNPENQQNPRLA